MRYQQKYSRAGSKRVLTTLGAFMMDAALEQKYNFVGR
jgi:hypothetical protein